MIDDGEKITRLDHVILIRRLVDFALPDLKELGLDFETMTQVEVNMVMSQREPV